MKNYFSFIKFVPLFLFFTFFLPLYASGGQDGRNYLKDVEREAGFPLTEEEKEIADLVFIFYNSYYGHSVRNITPQAAAKNLTPEEYANTVKQAAKVSKNGAAKGLQATGKAGEKLLKALIITTENAAKATGTWIDKKSKEYDSKKKE